MAIIQKGQEPANVKKLIDTLFPKLDSAYPNKVIISLQRDHKKWGETARKISKQLGYENKNEFLIAYGYKIEKLEGGRPSGDHMAIIEELKKRYPHGSPFQKVPDLAEENPDLSHKFKTLSNKANELFGMTFAKYLISEGILTKAKKEEKIPLSTEEKAEQRINKYRHQIYEVITELKIRYPDSSKAPGSLAQLKSENADLPIHNLTNWIQIAFEEKAIVYLEREKIINTKNRKSQEVVRAAARKTVAGTLEFVGRAFVTTGLNDSEEQIIKNIVQSQGGFFRTSVSKNTDYLIIDPSFIEGYISKKYQTATEWIAKGIGIQIIPYSEFLNLADQLNVKEIACEHIEEKKDIVIVKGYSTKEFKIENGVLTKYKGHGGNVVIPDGVTEIAEHVFQDYGKATRTIKLNDGECEYEKYYKYGLTSVTIPNSVTRIGACAFANCVLLNEVIFPDSAIEIGNYAFGGCESLKKIVMSEKVTVIGEEAFYGCNILADRDGFVVFNDILFGYFGNDECIRLPKNIKKIDGRAFESCKNLKSIIIPEGVIEIGKYAFASCVGLTKITIPNSVTKIGLSAFINCINLADVTLSDNLFEIGSMAFEGCKKLKSIIIPKSVNKIGSAAFRYCTDLTEITLLEGLTTIGISAFVGCSSLIDITIPVSVNRMYIPFGENDNVSLVVQKGSYAERYAKKKNIPFILKE